MFYEQFCYSIHLAEHEKIYWIEVVFLMKIFNFIKKTTSIQKKSFRACLSSEARNSAQSVLKRNRRRRNKTAWCFAKRVRFTAESEVIPKFIEIAFVAQVNSNSTCIKTNTRLITPS